MTTFNARTIPAWPQTLLKAMWADRWWSLLALALGAALTISVWLVPGWALPQVANDLLIAMGVVYAAVILVATLRTAHDGQPLSNHVNVFVPLRTALLTASLLPVVPSVVGPIATWQALGLWLRSHGLG